MTRFLATDEGWISERFITRILDRDVEGNHLVHAFDGQDVILAVAHHTVVEPFLIGKMPEEDA